MTPHQIEISTPELLQAFWDNQREHPGFFKISNMEGQYEGDTLISLLVTIDQEGE